jgi:hypothetical protein
MRCLPLLSALALISMCAGATAQTSPSTAPPNGFTFKAAKRTVYLNSVTLAELKESNPRHYAQAERVMASGSSLCSPGAAQLWKALDVPQGSCSGAFLRTSFPPKREISFQLDETLYVALVTITDAPAIGMHADDRVESPESPPATNIQAK